MQLVRRGFEIVKEHPSKAIAVVNAVGFGISFTTLVTSTPDNVQLDGVIGTAVLVLPFLAAHVYLTIYRMWFSPSRRVIVIILVLSVLSAVFLVSRDGIGALGWRGVLTDVVVLGLSYLAWFEPRVVRRGQPDPIAAPG